MKKTNLRIKENITLQDKINVVESIVEDYFRGGKYTPYFAPISKIVSIATYFIEGYELEEGDNLYTICVTDGDMKRLIETFIGKYAVNNDIMAEVNSYVRYDNRKIKLPKIGWVKTKDKQLPQERILNATISQEPNGHYYCSLCCTDVEVPQFTKTNKNIGIDLGICDFAIFSDGTKIENPRFYEKSEKQLAILQRRMSRKTKGGSNWNKARIKVANLQKHISSQRKDFLQKLTTDIVKNYDIICIEDLDVKSLKESDNTQTNKHISDVSWSEFRRMLTYKTQWYGKELSVVDRFYPSSQTCHICGHVSGKKSIDIRAWTCPNCQSELDRDINAAINILNGGLRIITVGTTEIAYFYKSRYCEKSRGRSRCYCR